MVCPEQESFKRYIIELKEDTWGQQAGGLSTKRLKHGFFDQAYAQQSNSWKSKGGKTGTRKWHVRMKKEHPEEYSKIQYARIKQSLKYKYELNGQKYRNILELEVAKILVTQSKKFEYERHLKCGNKFYFPDFIIGEIVIECTFWYDVAEKVKELSQKIETYSKINLQTIIVTTDRYLTKYSELLANLNVTVITPNQLTEVLDGKSGRVKESYETFSRRSVRIEHQPPKLGVEGSNPSPPAIYPLLVCDQHFWKLLAELLAKFTSSQADLISSNHLVFGFQPKHT